jgi:hypothetical protein
LTSSVLHFGAFPSRKEKRQRLKTMHEFSFANAMSIHRVAPGYSPPINLNISGV